MDTTHEVHEVLLGVVGLPAIVMATVLTVKRVLGTSAHLDATGRIGTLLNLGMIVALFIIPWTSEIAYLFYGIPMFLAAWRGYPGCEMMAISNLILRRHDELGCPWFWPIDTLSHKTRCSALTAGRKVSGLERSDHTLCGLGATTRTRSRWPQYRRPPRDSSQLCPHTLLLAASQDPSADQPRRLTSAAPLSLTLTLAGLPNTSTSAAPDASPVIDSEANTQTSVPPLASISTEDG